MQFSNKILVSLLIFGLANPIQANTESEKEDPNKPYYYIGAAVTVVLGAFGLGYIKRDAIRGCFKKKPEQPADAIFTLEELPVMELKETFEESSQPLHASGVGGTNTLPPADMPEEGGASKVVEVLPMIAAIVATQVGDSITEGTTASCSTVTVTASPETESSQAAKKQPKEVSSSIREKMKILETVHGQAQESKPSRVSPALSKKNEAIKPKAVVQPSQNSEAQVDESQTENFAEKKERIAKLLGNGPCTTPTVSEIPVHRPRLQAVRLEKAPVISTTTAESTTTATTTAPQPVSVRPYEISSSERDIEVAVEGIKIPTPEYAVAWVLVSEHYDELDDFMGVSLPRDGYAYCFVNPDTRKVILSGTIPDTGVVTLTYKGERFHFWRISGASHSTIGVLKAAEADPTDMLPGLPFMVFVAPQYRDANGHIEIEHLGIKIPVAARNDVSIYVTEQVDLDNLGIFLPPLGLCYIFVNSDVNNEIFPTVREKSGWFYYGNDVYKWKRIEQSSHNTISLRYAGPLKTKEVVKKEKKERSERAKQEKQAKQEKEKQEAKAKGKAEKEHQPKKSMLPWKK